MKAGVSKRDITPAIGACLADHTKRSTGVHDPLFLNTLVLDDGENPLAFVCLDILNGGFGFCDTIREEIRIRTGIQHTLINFSQSHSAPWLLPPPGIALQQEEIDLMERLYKDIPEAVEEACSELTTVTLHASRAPAEIAFNRRKPDADGVVRMTVNKEAPAVPWVNVLHACTEDGNPFAVLFEYAAHPVIVHGSSSLIGTDFTGFAIRQVQKKLGEDVAVMFAQGCCGNTNGFPLKSGWKAAEEAGKTLGDAVLEAMENSTEIKANHINVQSKRLQLPTQNLPSLDALNELSTSLKILDYNFYSAHMEQLDQMKAMVKRGEQPEMRFDMSAVMLGNEWCLVTLAHEPFCEYELWVDAHAPFDYNMTFGDTNGMVVYVGTDEALARGAKGGYEAGGFPCFWSHSIRVMHASLAVGIEDMIKEGIASLWAH